MRKNQRNFQFTLVLKNVDENTPSLEDSLYEAGCDDALINFRNGTVYLDFDRQASSLDKAVMSAIKDVESAKICATVASIEPDNFVSEAEIASRLHSNRQTVSLWIKGNRRKARPFPKPIRKLSQRSPLWRWSEVIDWLLQNNIIQDNELIDNARFLENLNAVLDERDTDSHTTRVQLTNQLRKISHPRFPM